MKKLLKNLLKACLNLSRPAQPRPVDLVRKRFEDAAIARKKAAYKKMLEDAAGDPASLNRHTGPGTFTNSRGFCRDPFDSSGSSLW